VLLLAMSLATWMVIIIKALDLRKIAAQARSPKASGTRRLRRRPEQARHRSVQPVPRPGAGRARSDGAPPRAAAAARFAGRERLAHALAAQLDRRIDGAPASGLAILASTGSTAPFIGLFGTVWGIYHALMSISAAGNATIDKVAGPIGEALIMTALGLAVAIPAVLGYNAWCAATRAS
jgi:biopolymer transport protein ExbB